MKRIKLTRGKFALVDDVVFEYLSKWKWYCSYGYALRCSSRIFGKRHAIFMHHEIVKPPIGKEIDHWDGNGLNNQKSNLRICTHANNVRSRKTPFNNTSGYKGVTWHIQHNKWYAQIGVKGKRIYLGLFDDVRDAAQAYDRAALKYYKKFSKLNFPEGEK